MTQCGSFESNLGGEQWPEPILCANVAPRFAPTCVQYKLHQVILIKPASEEAYMDYGYILVARIFDVFKKEKTEFFN